MKPVIEFCLACLLIFAGGCSAIAGIFSAGIWTAFIIAASVVGLVLMFSIGPKSKQ